ncbi:MAG: nitroreductase [Actinobacteria bacterium]|nr:nitroreductase [Actinomycetota bacterium]
MKYEELRELVRTRRTDMMVDKDRALDAGVVEKLCELAMWAPNHKLTFPSMFAAVSGDARERLSNCVADAMAREGDKPEKVTKARTKFQRAPVILIVGTELGDTQLRTEENRDAVSAGIQNILLGATSLGLASFWSSCPKGVNDDVANFCGFKTDTHITAMIYLGHPQRQAPAIERPPVKIKLITS